MFFFVFPFLIKICNHIKKSYYNFNMIRKYIFNFHFLENLFFILSSYNNIVNLFILNHNNY